MIGVKNPVSAAATVLRHASTTSAIGRVPPLYAVAASASLSAISHTVDFFRLQALPHLPPQRVYN